MALDIQSLVAQFSIYGNILEINNSQTHFILQIEEVSSSEMVSIINILEAEVLVYYPIVTSFSYAGGLIKAMYTIEEDPNNQESNQTVQAN